MPLRSILAAVVAAAAVVAVAHPHSGPPDCRKVSAIHGVATLELDGIGATCAEARSVVAAWLRTGEPDQGAWFCQSFRGAAAGSFTGGCEHFPRGDLSAPTDASVTVEVRR
jgi:hypothetical protein